MCFEWNFSEFISFVKFHSKFLGFVPTTNGKVVLMEEVVAYERVVG